MLEHRSRSSDDYQRINDDDDDDDDSVAPPIDTDTSIAVFLPRAIYLAARVHFRSNAARALKSEMFE